MDRTVVISRHGAGDEGRRAREDALAGACAGVPGLDVLLVPHLYHLPEDSPVWPELASLQGKVALAAWLHPRPAEWLLRAHGVQAGLWAFHLETFPTAAECLPALLAALAVPPEEASLGTLRELQAPVGSRWYPVVDRSRCTHCGHCVQFCLFGVYDRDAAGRPIVRNPDRCKPGCPACSRVCPEGAILFPLYERDEAIAGAPGTRLVPDAAARRMFYTRTGTPCPRCGGTPGRPGSLPAPAAPVCEECGRRVEAPPAPGGVPGPGYDDIEALIADLDTLARRRA